MRRLSVAIELALVVGATLYAAVNLYRAPAWTVDDAYIVCRYADHLARTGTLSWNATGARVEGFTSLVSVLYAALASVLHLSPIRALTVLGELSFLAAGPIIVALGRALRAPPPAAGVIAIVHLTTAQHITHATSGLETELFVTLSLCLALALARRSALGVSILAFLLVITRPEGLAAAGLAVVMIAWEQRRHALWPVLGALVLPVLAVLAWRRFTFDAFAPNTYYAKHGTWNRAHLLDLWWLTKERTLDVLVLSAGAFLLPRRPRPLPRDLLVVATAVVAAHSLAYGRSEPIMDYARRFAIHDVAWLEVIALVLLGNALRSLRRRRELAFLLVVATFAVVRRGVLAEPDEWRRMRDYERFAHEAEEPIVAWLRQNISPNAVLAVYPDAGLVPYVTDLTTIDFGLLNDASLARGPHTPAFAVAYFFDRLPDVLVVGDKGDGKLYDEGADAIVVEPRFREQYVLAYQQHGTAGTGYLVYLRRSMRRTD